MGGMGIYYNYFRDNSMGEARVEMNTVTHTISFLALSFFRIFFKPFSILLFQKDFK